MIRKCFNIIKKKSQMKGLMGNSSDMQLKQHGGEGKEAIKQTKTDIKFSKPDCGPGRYL